MKMTSLLLTRITVAIDSLCFRVLAQVSWIAKLSEDSTEAEDVALSSQLQRTAGTAICPGRQAFCYFNLSLVNDDVSDVFLLLVKERV